jgi:predicted site-specific integrase-resolvase
MAKVTLTEAAKMVGVSRVTLYKRYINNGVLSIDRDANGKPKVDTSELMRVFGDISKGGISVIENVSEERKNLRELTAELYTKNEGLQTELRACHALLQAKQEEFDRVLEEILWLRKKVDSMEQRLLTGPDTKRRWWWPW